VDIHSPVARVHGERDVRTPEIPQGWEVVTGPLLSNDRYWSAEKLIWLPVTVNSFYLAEDFPVAIRKEPYVQPS